MEMTLHGQTNVGQIEQAEHSQQRLEATINGKIDDAPPIPAAPALPPRPMVIAETK